MKPNADDLSQYTEADFTALEQAVGKERKHRNKIARSGGRICTTQAAIDQAIVGRPAVQQEEIEFV